MRELEVQLIASTQFHIPEGLNWVPDQCSGAEALTEFASRLHDNSFESPQPRTRTNRAYLLKLLAVGREKILEHASATLYIRGISRDCVHQMLSFRRLMITEMNPDRVDREQRSIALAKTLRNNRDARRMVDNAVDDLTFLSRELAEVLAEQFHEENNAVLKAKEISAALRGLEPGLSESPVVVSSSIAGWRDFLKQSGGENAEQEIQEVAKASFAVLSAASPLLWADFPCGSVPPEGN
ncbi:thymidylate synthase (FAD) [Corynebacterium poyangense]|uniref:Thymidylate synthase (FAD) n=1 Tax=Corynebacterium poyangense TaxID=2684405 RepID=A0A7H0SPE6_9CORY|nr:FAD-dependent thymidylate synthase [Corynebacterium poyangense]QNQ90421.1 thymidylate synthase (FAD) [Corynebacterium poyangense]